VILIRVYADAMRGGMLLSRMEVANLKRILDWYFQNSGVKGSDPDDLFGRMEKKAGAYL